MRASIPLVLLLSLPLSATAAPRRHAAGRPVGIVEVQRVMLVILENEDAAPAEQQPFLAALAARGALLRSYHALTHPSQPNYIALTAGSAYGVADDNPVTINVPHLGDLLEARGVSWKVYAEQYPGNCFLGAASGSVATGQYARKHLPFLDYTNIQTSRQRCTRSIVDSGQLDSDVRNGTLPPFAMYIPNLRNDGHDTSVAVADTWLRQRFETLLADPRFNDHLLFIVVFDEGSSSGPNIVYCSLSGAGIRPGSVSDDYYDHYDLLRTIEEIFHTGTLGHHDATAQVIQGIWH